MSELFLLHFPRILMVICGVWRLPYFKSKKVQTVYDIFSIFLQFTFSLMCLSMFFELVNLIKTWNVLNLIEFSPVALSSYLCIIKALVLRNSSIQRIMVYMIKEERNVLRSKHQQPKALYMDTVKLINRVSFLLLLVVLPTLLAFSADCLRKGIIDFDDAVKYVYLPLIDQKKYKTVQLTVQTIFINLIGFYYCMTQAFMVTAMKFAQGQLDLLQLYFREFDYYAARQSTTEIAYLKTLLEYHQEIIQ